MITADMAEPFVAVERALSEGKGPIALFGLFQTEESANRWDLVISAPWADSDKKETFDAVITEIKNRLGADALLNLSRLVLLDPSSPAVAAIHKAFDVEHTIFEVQNADLFGMHVPHGFIITSRAVPSRSAPALVSAATSPGTSAKTRKVVAARDARTAAYRPKDKESALQEIKKVKKRAKTRRPPKVEPERA